MNTMNTEQAYQSIAMELVQFIGKRTWDRAQTKVRILKSMLNVSWRVYLSGTESGSTEDGGWPNWDKAISSSAEEACWFLRDNLLATTGDRIWGLTFTLFPDGKFKIEYDYNKPEGYEETDEVISLDEALLNLPMSRDQER